MSDNVVDLTARLSKRNKTVNWSQVATLVKALLTDGLVETPLHQLVSRLPEHQLLAELSDSAWSIVDVGANHEEEKSESEYAYDLSFGSSFRRMFVPEYGQQDLTVFMHIDADYTEDTDRSNVDPLKPATREEVLHILNVYSNRFPPTESILWRFPYAFLDTLYQTPKVELLGYKFEAGLLTMAFAVPYIHDGIEESLLVRVTFDFLPLVLDANADTLLDILVENT